MHLLPDSQHPINKRFQSFIHHQACQANELYILGDLFETWVGDDIGIAQYQTEINLIKQLTQQGVRVYIGFGNRDFLMGNAFWQATGASKLDDIEIINIQGQSLLILHGDLLCSDDIHYQKMRRWFQKPWLQWLFLKLPKKTRLNIARKLREQSSRQSYQKPSSIMDVSDHAVMDLFQRFPQTSTMIHGHTHRPNQHQITVNGQPKTRWVLGDWRPDAKVIKIENGQIEFIDI